MKLIFDTMHLPAERQFDHYARILAERLAPFAVRRGKVADPGFQARFYSGVLDGLEISHGLADSHWVGQSQRASADNPFAYALLMPLGNTRLIQQLDGESCEAVVEPGQLMLNHSRQSGWIHLPDGMNLLAVHFPEGKLPEELASPVRRNGRVILKRHGEGDVLGGFVEQVMRSLDNLSAGSERLLAEQLVGLVALALRRHEVVDVRQAPKHEIERGLLRTAWRLIEQHLHRPGLTAREIAGRLGLSERHFYRLLKRNGISFRRELLKRRLERAAGELADPALAHLSINAIALGSGFASASHFTRTFRHHFGCTPSDYRDKHIA